MCAAKKAERLTKLDWQHRVIRWASMATIVVSFGILVWGR